MKISGVVHLQNSDISLGEIVWITGTNLGSYDTGGASGGVPASFTVHATGPGVVTYALTSGSLPPSLTLNTSTGVISGTGKASAPSHTYTFTITASVLGLSSAKSFQITALDSAGGDIGN